MLPGLYYMFLVVETYVKRFFNTDFHHNTETTFTNASVHITMIIFHVVNRNVRALDKRVIVNVSKNGTVAISEIGWTGYLEGTLTMHCEDLSYFFS